MNTIRSFRSFMFLVIAFGAAMGPALAQKASSGSSESPVRDGGHDFDFELGRWRTHLRRLIHPLSGSTAWAEYEGTTVVRKVWGGAANLVELEVGGSAGHISALSLRLYDPATHQWNLNFANHAVGQMSVPPATGAFKDGRGEFTDQEDFNGRMILVRFVISDITADSCHFEQSYSADGGKTWELNWIATDVRLAERGAS